MLHFCGKATCCRGSGLVMTEGGGGGGGEKIAL